MKKRYRLFGCVSIATIFAADGAFVSLGISALRERTRIPFQVVLASSVAEAQADGGVTNTAEDKVLDFKNSHRKCRPPLFDKTNVYVEPTKVPPNTWNQIVPSPFATSEQFRHHSSNVDVSVTFINAEDGAQQLVDQCFTKRFFLSQEKKDQVFDHLKRCLQLYCDVYSAGTSSCSVDKPTQYKARIVASRGISGVKCPRWHVDHVPVRLVCALEGPGAVYVDEFGNAGGIQNAGRRRLVNESDETNTQEVNTKILEYVSAKSIKRAPTGDAVFLIGKEWEDHYPDGITSRPNKEMVLAAVHRSPDLSPAQSRVLLTVDVVLND